MSTRHAAGARRGPATGWGLAPGSSPASPWLLIGALAGLLALLAWFSQLEVQLPNARIPITSGPTPILYPGSHAVVGAPLRVTGDWLPQPLGPVTWLTTGAPGSSLEFTFYGTRVTATMRMGPESGRAYLTVDGRPAPGLRSDHGGTYVSLSGARAVAEPVTLVSGLNHGEHVVTISNGPDGQLAIAALDVAAQTPVPWAFGMAYTFVVLVSFAVVRQLFVQAALQLGWLTPGQAIAIRYVRRRPR